LYKEDNNQNFCIGFVVIIVNVEACCVQHLYDRPCFGFISPDFIIATRPFSPVQTGGRDGVFGLYLLTIAIIIIDILLII